MNCPNCGKPMGAEDIFCGVCGARTQPQPTPPIAPTPPQPPIPGTPEVVAPTSPVPPVMPEIVTPNAPVKKKSKKKKIIIITAIVTALAIIAGILSWIFIFSKESVWLITSEIHYEADGSRGGSRWEYTYTEKGLPLEMTCDRGGTEKYWDDVNGYYIYYSLPYDGTIDSSVEFGYNEEGDILYTIRRGANGEDSDEGAISYNYDEKGRIEFVNWYISYSDVGYTDEIGSIDHYCYDDDGNLIEIYTEDLEDGTTCWKHDFRYDSKNRLIGYTNRQKEGCYYYQYEYNDKGQLTDMTLSRAPYQTPLDNEHVSESYLARFYKDEFTVVDEWEFTYDSDGNLISRECNGESLSTCSYDSKGKLSTVTCSGYVGEETYRYADEDTGADEDDIVLVRDKNGNIVKKIYPGGYYVEYTYQEFRLTKEEAQHCRNAQMGLHGVAPIGSTFYSVRMNIDYGFLKYLPIPTTDLMQFDILTCKD